MRFIVALVCVLGCGVDAPPAEAKKMAAKTASREVGFQIGRDRFPLLRLMPDGRAIVKFTVADDALARKTFALWTSHRGRTCSIGSVSDCEAVFRARYPAP